MSLYLLIVAYSYLDSTSFQQFFHLIDMCLTIMVGAFAKDFFAVEVGDDASACLGQVGNCLLVQVVKYDSHTAMLDGIYFNLFSRWSFEGILSQTPERMLYWS